MVAADTTSSGNLFQWSTILWLRCDYSPHRSTPDPHRARTGPEMTDYVTSMTN